MPTFGPSDENWLPSQANFLSMDILKHPFFPIILARMDTAHINLCFLLIHPENLKKNAFCFEKPRLLGVLHHRHAQPWLFTGITWKTLNKTWCLGPIADQFHRISGGGTKASLCFSKLSRVLQCIAKVERTRICLNTGSLSHLYQWENWWLKNTFWGLWIQLNMTRWCSNP